MTSIGRGSLWGALVAALFFLAPHAKAALGGPSASVESDRSHFRAARTAQYAADYSVSTLNLANGTTVREYVNAGDTVFAVSWRGRSRPDLAQLLGPSFQTLQADAVRVAGPRTRAPLHVGRPGLMLQSGGHPGAFWGRAWLPQSVPAGVFVGALQ